LARLIRPDVAAAEVKRMLAIGAPMLAIGEKRVERAIALDRCGPNHVVPSGITDATFAAAATFSFSYPCHQGVAGGGA
jgi:hypothetical protein